MNSEWKQRWMDALRSGNYIQAQRKLRTMDDKFCCLGVLCDLIDPNKWVEGTVMSRPAYGWSDPYQQSALHDEELELVDMTETQQWDLVHLNDDGKSFVEIADYIEREL